MAKKSDKNPIQKFLSSKKEFPLVAGILSGVYPMFFYATNNYTLVNTWGHLLYFVGVFIILPVLLIYGVYIVSKSVSAGKFTKYVIPVLGSFLFMFFMHIAVYGGLRIKIILGLFIIACGIGYFLWRHSKKILVIQAILGLIGFVTFIPKPFESAAYDESWQEQKDAIESVQFTTTPNVYFIQPDGYVNFSELYQGHYQATDSSFQQYLGSNGFDFYPNFRSNYASTLTSNSATFMMKHHYYDRGLSLETFNARNIIVSDNPVLTIFKNNGYKTHFLTELPYLLLNRPQMGYDYCNFSYDKVSYIGTGLGERVDILPSLKESLDREEGSKFFFIEIFNPGHINGSPQSSHGIAEERTLWLEGMRVANMRLKEMITVIKAKDKNALIVIMADHGGYVGLEHTGEAYTKTQDRDILYSIFSSNLAVHWPDGIQRGETHLKSAVNLFRVLFSYLGQDKNYLENTEDNSSYIVIKDGAPSGVYKCIDTNGDIVFEKQE